MLKRREEFDTYLSHVCRHHRSGENSEKIKYKIKLSANTVAFISCRSRLTKVLGAATREKKGSMDGRGLLNLPNVGTGRLLGLKYKLICHFKLMANIVRVAIGSL